MELTKFERRIMHHNYLRKCRWSCFYLGLVCLVMGIFVAIFGYMKTIPQTSAIWENNIAMLKTIVPSTKNETELFNVAMRAMDAARRGWTGFVEEKTRSTSVVFLFVGAFLL